MAGQPAGPTTVTPAKVQEKDHADFQLLESRRERAGQTGANTGGRRTG